MEEGSLRSHNTQYLFIYRIKESYCFHIGMRCAPDILGPSGLTQAVHTDDALADGKDTRGELPNPYQDADGHLTQRSQTEDDLSEPEKKSQPGLRDCDQPDSELTDCYNAFGHQGPAAGIHPNCDMD